MTRRERLAAPGTWALGCGAFLLAALALPANAPHVAFWGAITLSCACGVAYVLLSPEDD